VSPEELDFLIARYGGGIDYFMNLPFEDGIDVMAAAEKQYEGRNWGEFIQKNTVKEKPLRPKAQTQDEIMSNVNDIIRATVR